MTLENQNNGSEYGIEAKRPITYHWILVDEPGEGLETYEEAYQKALKALKELSKSGFHNIQLRVVVYDYDGPERKNVRILTTITA